jgi:heterodisulfide reductase subunit B
MGLELSYFPGCSGHGTGVEQDLSTRAVCEALGVTLHELADWNCCGATAAHAVGGDLVTSLGARNLRIAEEAGRDLMVPCAACFGNLRAAARHLREGRAPEGIDAPKELVDIVSVARLLSGRELLEEIRERAGARLAGLRVVPYYGCLLVRPPETTGATDPDDPQEIDVVARACGAEVLQWSYKTLCCGGGLFVARGELVEGMTGRLLDMAARVGGDCIVTACPMCQSNLDTQQWLRLRRGAAADARAQAGPAARPIPTLFLTELVALALGLPAARRWLGRHLVDPRPLLERTGVAT